MLSITPIYLAIAIFIYSVLAFAVVGNRRSQKVSIGDGGYSELARRIRSHGNFSEYVPLAIIALGAAEVTGASPQVLHLCGASLIVGRCLHAFYFLVSPNMMKIRVAGMMFTFLAMWGASGMALWSVIDQTP